MDLLGEEDVVELEACDIPEEDCFVCPAAKELPQRARPLSQKAMSAINQPFKDSEDKVVQLVKVRGLEGISTGSTVDKLKEFQVVRSYYESRSLNSISFSKSVKEIFSAIENDPTAYSRVAASGSYRLTGELAFAGNDRSNDMVSNPKLFTSDPSCCAPPTSAVYASATASGPCSTSARFLAERSDPERPLPAQSLFRRFSSDSDISTVSQDPCPSPRSVPWSRVCAIEPQQPSLAAPTGSLPASEPAATVLAPQSRSTPPVAHRIAAGERLAVVSIDGMGDCVLQAVTFRYSDGSAATFPDAAAAAAAAANFGCPVASPSPSGNGWPFLLHVGEYISTVRFRRRRAALTHHVLDCNLELLTSLGRTVTLGGRNGVRPRSGAGAKGGSLWTAGGEEREFRAAAGSGVVGLRLAGDSDCDYRGDEGQVSEERWMRERSRARA